MKSSIFHTVVMWSSIALNTALGGMEVAGLKAVYVWESATLHVIVAGWSLLAWLRWREMQAENKAMGSE